MLKVNNKQQEIFVKINHLMLETRKDMLKEFAEWNLLPSSLEGPSAPVHVYVAADCLKSDRIFKNK